VNTLEYIQVTANGQRFNVATAGSGPRLALCLHGFPESSFSWRFQIPLLAGLGYRVWAPDLRGFLARNDYAAIAAAFRGMAVDKSRFPREVLDEYKRSAAQPGALTAMVNYYRALLRGRRRTAQRGMPRIHVPVLMLWGEADTALGKELTYGTDGYVDKLVLRYLPNVSHWVQQEAPETVNAMMDAWLRCEPVPYAPGAGPA
jgi:pimeloyl-ACP methyl ester carboxylesterase